MKSLIGTLAMLAPFALPLNAAVGQSLDIGIQVMDGKLVTGVVNDQTLDLSFPHRVFTRDFNAALLSLDPGFFALANGSALLPAGIDALPAHEDLFWDFLPMTIEGERSNLLFWDGLDKMPRGLTSEDVAFEPSENSRFDLNTPSGGLASAQGEDELIPGAKIEQTEFDGSIHRHGLLELISTAGGSPQQGVYLVALQFRMDGLQASDPVLLAMRTSSIDEDAETAAAGWLEENLDELFAEPLAGDFNGDGFVDTADFTVWRDGYSLGDYTVDDYLAWRGNFGAGEPPTVVQAAPSPSAASLMALAALAAGLPRRRGLR